MSFRDVILKFSRPGFLSQGYAGSPPSVGQGGRFMYGIGLMLDGLAEHGRQGILARMPGYGTPSAHPYLGRERGIVKGFAASDDVYAAQLQKWLDAWKGAGNPWALMLQIAAYLSPYPTTLRTVDNSGNWHTLNPDLTTSVYQSYPTSNWDWDSVSNPSQPDQWARMWVIIYANSFLELQDNWGAPGQWGGAWGNQIATWGTTATPDQIADIRAMVQYWAAAHTKMMTVILAFDDASFDPATTTLDGTWGRWSKKVAGVRVASRLATARYLEIER